MIDGKEVIFPIDGKILRSNQKRLKAMEERAKLLAEVATNVEAIRKDGKGNTTTIKKDL